MDGTAHLLGRRGAVHKRTLQGLEAHQVVGMDMAQKARQRLLLRIVPTEEVDPNVRELWRGSTGRSKAAEQQPATIPLKVDMMPNGPERMGARRPNVSACPQRSAPAGWDQTKRAKRGIHHLCPQNRRCKPLSTATGPRHVILPWFLAISQPSRRTREQEVDEEPAGWCPSPPFQSAPREMTQRIPLAGAAL
jgi:hypothetical protein